MQLRLPSFKLRSLLDYRLGYAIEREYPWRWMTLFTILLFLVLTVILALVNIPLSAYTVIQEFTTHPNSSLPPILFHALVPSILQGSDAADSFTPQVMSVGDQIRPNGSMYTYEITSIYDALDDSQPAASMFYYNNPLSEACDVTNITLKGDTTPTGGVVSALIRLTCQTASLFTMQLAFQDNTTHFGSTADPRWSIPAFMYSMLQTNWGQGAKDGTFRPNISVVDIDVAGDEVASEVFLNNFELTVRPCCQCSDVSLDAQWNDGVFSVGHPPQSCSSKPSQLMAIDAAYHFLGSLDLPAGEYKPNSTTFFPASSKFPFVADTTEPLTTLLRNLLQTLYHTVRLDLAIVSPNQILTSAEMFNDTTSVPSSLSVIDTNNMLILRRTATGFTKFWTQEMTDIVRTPVMSYLRTVPRVKDTGAAITSVFTSTFAMMSTIWTVFTLIAVAVAKRAAKPSQGLVLTETDDYELGASTPRREQGETDSDSDHDGKPGHGPELRNRNLGSGGSRTTSIDDVNLLPA